MKRFDLWNVAGWVLATAGSLVLAVGMAGGFIALLAWNRIAFLAVVSHAVAYGLGVVTRDQRRRLLAFSHHFLGEEVEAVHGADLDADVAAERARRLPDRQSVDEDPWAMARMVGMTDLDDPPPTTLDISEFWSIRCESSGASPIRMTGTRDVDAQDRELTDIYGIDPRDHLGQACDFPLGPDRPCCNRPAEGWVRWDNGHIEWLCGDHYAAVMGQGVD